MLSPKCFLHLARFSAQAQKFGSTSKLRKQVVPIGISSHRMDSQSSMFWKPKPTMHLLILQQSLQEEIIYPPPACFWPNGIFQGRWVGVHILRPHAAGIPTRQEFYIPPPFYTPPTPRRACVVLFPQLQKAPKKTSLRRRRLEEVRGNILSHLC